MHTAPSSSPYSYHRMRMMTLVGPYFLLMYQTPQRRATGGRSRRGWCIHLVFRRLLHHRLTRLRLFPRPRHKEQRMRSISLPLVRGGRPISWGERNRPPASIRTLEVLPKRGGEGTATRTTMNRSMRRGRGGGPICPPPPGWRI